MSANQQYESFVPVYDVVPEKWEEARPFLVEILKKITNSLNVKEIGYCLNENVLTGKNFIPGTNGEQRSIFREAYDFGALPNATTSTLAHNLTFDANFSLISLTASATDPVAFKSIPIPYATETASGDIEISLDSTNIIITTSLDYSAYTRCFVMIEYIQEL